MEVELVAIRCGINQSINISSISKIIVITDSLHVVRKIFNLSIHLYQKHTVAILYELRRFFSNNINNSIEFWECPSQYKWSFHKVVDTETKCFRPLPIFPYKSSWEFSKKSKYNDILSNWKMIFQASELKGQYFLELFDKDNNPLEPIYTKGRSWLKYLGHSNSLYASVTTQALSAGQKKNLV